jgi:hypothetical protein
MADVWRLLFYQMSNGEPHFTFEVPLFQVAGNSLTFSSKLNDVGQMSATIQQSDPGIVAAMKGLSPWHLLDERTSVYIDLNGRLVWGGILQQSSYQRSKHQTKIQAQEFWGYWMSNRLITWNASYTNVDQLFVAADLMNIAEGGGSIHTVPNIASGTVVGGNIGILQGQQAIAALASTRLSGVLVTVAYPATSLKQVGQAITDLATSSVGFDHSIDVGYADSYILATYGVGLGQPYKLFNLWYPRAGRTAQQQKTSGAQVIFHMRGLSGQDYVWNAGAVASANTVFGAGSGAGSTAITSTAANASLLTQGWPLTEAGVSWTDINDQNLLNHMTAAYLAQIQMPVAQPVIYYDPGENSDAPLGSFAMGDDCRVIIEPDDYFPNGYDSEGSGLGQQFWRIIAWQVNVTEQGRSQMQVTLGVPPVIVTS